MRLKMATMSHNGQGTPLKLLNSLLDRDTYGNQRFSPRIHDHPSKQNQTA